MKIELTTDEIIFRKCAEFMAESDPWLTLRRDLLSCANAIHGDNKELYVVTEADEILGFAVLQMTGTFKRYIQSIYIRPERRGEGIGATLLKFCEDRIFTISPNVFMCVSAFNLDAARLYFKLGYEEIGELEEFIIRGHSEILLRKTTGPISEF